MGETAVTGTMCICKQLWASTFCRLDLGLVPKAVVWFGLPHSQESILHDLLIHSMPLCRFELGDVHPTIEDVRVFPGTDPGAEDIFLEFDFHWRGNQNISLLLNPTPKVMQSVPGLSTLVNKMFTWTVSPFQVMPSHAVLCAYVGARSSNACTQMVCLHFRLASSVHSQLCPHKQGMH